MFRERKFSDGRNEHWGQFEIMVDIAWQVVRNIKLRSVWMAGLAKRVRASVDCFERLFSP